MRDNLSHVFRWLDGKQGPPTHDIDNEYDDDATQDITEVLKSLACHWRKAWKRSSVELSDFREIMLRTLGPSRETNVACGVPCGASERGGKAKRH